MGDIIKHDPSFERLRKTLRLEGKADRVPLFDFNISKTIMGKYIGKPIKTAVDEIDFWVNAGYDYVQIRLKPNSLMGGRVSKPVVSSHGELKTLDQLKTGDFEWTDIYKDTWKMSEYNYDYLNQIAKNLPSDMKLIVHAADIFTRSWMAMGFEDFSYALFEDPELIEELFRQNAIAEMRMLERTVDSFENKIGAILYSDDLAYTEGLMVSANVYRTYLWQYVRQITNIAKRLDIPVIFHTDGRLWNVFDDFHDMGINAIQPLEPKSMDFKELKEKRGNQFCLIGSIDIDILSRGSAAEIDEMVRERIETLGYNGGYVVGTSNTVPEYVNVDNYKAMKEAAFKYGKY